MSPANFLATNPEAQQKIIETHGQSLTQGLAQMVADLLASLSPDDRAAVVKAQQAKRMEAVTNAMSALNDDQLAAVMKSIQPVPGRKTA